MKVGDLALFPHFFGIQVLSLIVRLVWQCFTSSMGYRRQLGFDFEKRPQLRDFSTLLSQKLERK